MFHQKLESLQYNAYLAITGVICSSSREKLYQELGFETLEQRRWYRKPCSFYKIFKSESPCYSFNIIPIRNPAYSTRNHINIPLFKTNHNFFKNSFFPSTKKRLFLSIYQEELFWSAFSSISISPYSFRMQESADQNNSEYAHFLRSDDLWFIWFKMCRYNGLAEKAA